MEICNNFVPRTDDFKPENTELSEVDDGNIVPDLVERVGELVRPEINVPSPEGGQTLTEAELINPVLTVVRLRRVEIAPENTVTIRIPNTQNQTLKFSDTFLSGFQMV